MQRYDPGFDANILLVIYLRVERATKRYVCGLCGGTSDAKVLDRPVCIGAFYNRGLCFCW